MCNPFNLSPLSQPCIADDRPDSPVLTSIQPFQGEFNFGDSSGPLFSIYSRAAEEEDNRMVMRWQRDADGILIFVSPHVGIDKISSGDARVDNDVQSISNGLILSSTVPRVDNDANMNQLSTKV